MRSALIKKCFFRITENLNLFLKRRGLEIGRNPLSTSVYKLEAVHKFNKIGSKENSCSFGKVWCFVQPLFRDFVIVQQLHLSPALR